MEKITEVSFIDHGLCQQSDWPNLKLPLADWRHAHTSSGFDIACAVEMAIDMARDDGWDVTDLESRLLAAHKCTAWDRSTSCGVDDDVFYAVSIMLK